MAAASVRGGVALRARPVHRSSVGLFPDTRISAIGELSSTDATTRERAAEAVVRAYRGPIIAVLRARLGLELADAEDLAHDFLSQALTKQWLQRYDPSKARFRTFLRSCLMAFASTAHEAAGRLKRGGGAHHLPLDAVAPAVHDPAGEELFDHEWARSILEVALERFHAECLSAGRDSTWSVFHARDVAGAEGEVPPSYGELAHRFDLPVTQVQNFLVWSRPRFRGHVLDALRALTTSDQEFRSEARALLGVEVR